ncbi:MAG TPA: flavodoxin family protein [Clostridia bacterium]|nr:flavodoxin family protein [Clostridia bacterium]
MEDFMHTRDAKIKVLGIVGSPKRGATYRAVKEALDAASTVPEVSVDMIELRGKKISFCIHCNKCIKNGLRYCPTFPEDDMRDLYQPMIEADAYIIGSPVYQMTVTGQLQTFFNRLRPIAPLFTEGLFATKVGGAIAVGGTRNGGQETTLETINNFFFCTGVVVVSGGVLAYNGGAIWSKDRGAKGTEEDEVGMRTLRVMGRRVAHIARVMKYGVANLPKPFSSSELAGIDQEEMRKGFEIRDRLREDEELEERRTFS